MKSETAKNYVNHVLSVALSYLELTSQLSSLDISIPDTRFGDYSTNAALVLAKQLKANLKEIAAKIIEAIKLEDKDGNLESVEEKAGFINFTLSKKLLFQNLRKIIEQGELYGCSVIGEGKIVVVEYFQNNVAKPPHVGHLRSAVIGDSLLRILKSQGYKVVSDTHIGDWGVQFGILLHAYKTMGDREVIEKDPINELNKLYVEMSAKIDADASLREKGKEEFVKLEKGDAENRELWQWFVRVSMEDFERYRNLLGILPFDHNLGESFYEDKMPAVLAELETKGLVKIGETGEKYVDLEEQGLGRCILVKSDGGTTYHLRDFATYIYRKKEFNFYKNIYVVDNRQSHHFKQLFKVLELAGYPALEDSEHVDLGFMSLPEGAISTRKGTTISLQNLISEAEKRAMEIIDEKNPELQNKEAVAKQVARAAIKYFDLSHNRKTEIVFTWDKALSFEGNTGPYLQYTHARIYGILRKAGKQEQVLDPGAFRQLADGMTLQQEELAVLRKLIQFPEVLEQVAEDYLPNILANYLFELSQTFNSFYQEIPVLQEENNQIKDFRLQLISATAQVISNGLYLLGIDAPEEM
jgi:arginyl-tRNA synthetase